MRGGTLRIVSSARCNLRRFTPAGMTVHTSRPRIAVTALQALTLAVASFALGAVIVAGLLP